MSEYLGHPSYEHWNVALWFGNDYKLYNFLRAVYKEYATTTGAARWLVDNYLPDQTPDQVDYTVERVEWGLDCVFEDEEHYEVSI